MLPLYSMPKSPLIYALAAASLLCGGCKKDFGLENAVLPPWQPVVAVPLATGSYSAADIIDTLESDVEFVTDASGLISLLYRGDLFSVNAADLLQIPNQVETVTFTLTPAQTAVLSNGQPVSVQQTLAVPVEVPLDNLGNEVRLDRVFFTSGTVSVTLAPLGSVQVAGDVELPQLLVGGTPQELLLADNGNTQTANVGQGVLTLTGADENTLTVQLSATLTPQNYSGEDTFTFTISLQDLAFSRIEGYFGNLTLSTDRDSIELSPYENLEGTLFLENPTIRLITTSTFGLPVEIEFEDFESINLETGETASLTGPGFPNPYQIAGATAVSEPAVNTLLLNNANSNINDLLNFAPKVIVGRIEATSNPDNNAQAVNFIDTASALQVDIDLELPLWGRGSVVLRDTLELSFGETDTDDIEEIDSCVVRMRFTNGFPLNLSGQIFFTDSLFQITDSLYTGERPILQSGEVTAGEVTASGVTVNESTFTNQRLATLLEARHVILLVRAETPGFAIPESVRIQESNAIQLDLGARIYANINLNGDE